MTATGEIAPDVVACQLKAAGHPDSAAQVLSWQKWIEANEREIVYLRQRVADLEAGLRTMNARWPTTARAPAESDG